MPPRSKKKLREKAKQKMLVVSRLMAIRLHVDDYIYKNKPISLIEASKYDEEITSLRLKCEQDERSLQVAEKLKKIMKYIINEHSTNTQDNVSVFTEKYVNNSPLIANFISEDVENNVINNLENTRELFSNSENQNFDINNTNQDNNKQLNVSIDIINPVIDGTDSDVKQDESNDKITLNKSTLKLKDKSEENVRYISFDKNEPLVNANDKEQTENFVVLTATNLQEQSDKVCITQENICPIQETEKPNKKIKKNTVNNEITRKPKKFINNTSKKLENKPSGVNKTKLKPKPKFQIDLSWVENIKYVREVNTDEHTDLQIDNSFWSNLTVPVSWNSNDFDKT